MSEHVYVPPDDEQLARFAFLRVAMERAHAAGVPIAALASVRLLPTASELADVMRLLRNPEARAAWVDQHRAFQEELWRQAER